MITIKGLISLSKIYHIQNHMFRLAKKSGACGHVLMFHHVTDQHVDTMEECLSTIHNFTTTLDSYKKQGYDFVSIDVALHYLRNGFQKKFVVITFDDIPESVFINAYPILKERSIPFAVFVAVNFVDKPGFITNKQLMALAADPLCTIGGHTMNHVNLAIVDNYEWEIKESKLELERLLNIEVKYFAYPFGTLKAVPSNVQAAARKAGYEVAFCTVNAPLSNGNLKENPFFLPRSVAMQGNVLNFEKKSIVKDAMRKLLC